MFLFLAEDVLERNNLRKSAVPSSGFHDDPNLSSFTTLTGRGWIGVGSRDLGSHSSTASAISKISATPDAPPTRSSVHGNGSNDAFPLKLIVEFDFEETNAW